jgi:hypothetical protein
VRRERECYCSLWDTDPALLERQGVPRGYCGLCERCGSPGHTQHFPGSMPYTGAWCDTCVSLIPWITPAVWIQIAFALVVVTVALAGTYAWIAG